MSRAPRPGADRLDPLDLNLIDALRADPRAPNTALAQALGVSEATIASRLKALHQDGVMRVIAQKDFRTEGYDVLALADVDTAGRAVDAVAADLARIDAVASVVFAMGNPAIIAQLCARDLAAMRDLVELQISAIPGVAGVETTIIVDIIKMEADRGRVSL